MNKFKVGETVLVRDTTITKVKTKIIKVHEYEDIFIKSKFYYRYQCEFNPTTYYAEKRILKLNEKEF